MYISVIKKILQGILCWKRHHIWVKRPKNEKIFKIFFVLFLGWSLLSGRAAKCSKKGPPKLLWAATAEGPLRACCQPVQLDSASTSLLMHYMLVQTWKCHDGRKRCSCKIFRAGAKSWLWIYDLLLKMRSRSQFSAVYYKKCGKKCQKGFTSGYQRGIRVVK